MALLLNAARAREEALDSRERGDWEGAHEVLASTQACMLELAGDDEDVPGVGEGADPEG